MVTCRQALQELSSSKIVQALQRQEKMFTCGMECKEKPVTFLKLIWAPLLSLTFSFAYICLNLCCSSIEEAFCSLH